MYRTEILLLASVAEIHSLYNLHAGYLFVIFQKRKQE